MLYNGNLSVYSCKIIVPKYLYSYNIIRILIILRIKYLLYFFEN